jgi:hypothetical protein
MSKYLPNFLLDATPIEQFNTAVMTGFEGVDADVVRSIKQFKTFNTYKKDEICFINNKFYKSKIDFISGDTFVDTDWDIVNIGDLTNYYTKTESDALLYEKSDKTDTYNKTESDALLNTKADASNVYTKTQTDTLLNTKADDIDLTNHNSSYTSHNGKQTTERTGIDANSIFTTVKMYRADGSLFFQSVLSGGTTPAYTLRTETWYDTDGTTVISTNIYDQFYDGSNNWLKEVPR